MSDQGTPEQRSLARRLRIQESLRDISRTQRWTALSEVLSELQIAATRELYEADGNDTAAVSRLQGECMTYDNILRTVAESEYRLAEVREEIEFQKLTNEAVDGLDREPPPGETI
jgi:hypothetical protein